MQQCSAHGGFQRTPKPNSSNKPKNSEPRANAAPNSTKPKNKKKKQVWRIAADPVRERLVVCKFDIVSHRLLSVKQFKTTGAKPFPKNLPEDRRLSVYLSKQGYGTAVAAGSMAEKLAKCVTLPEETNPMTWPAVSTKQLSVLSSKTAFPVPYSWLAEGGVPSSNTFESVVYSEGKGLFDNTLYTWNPSLDPTGGSHPIIADGYNLQASPMNIYATTATSTNGWSKVNITGSICLFNISSSYDNSGGPSDTAYNNGSLSGPCIFKLSDGTVLNSYPSRVNGSGTFYYSIGATIRTVSSSNLLVKCDVSQPGQYLKMTWNNSTTGASLSFSVPADGDFYLFPFDAPDNTGVSNRTNFRIVSYDGRASSGIANVSWSTSDYSWSGTQNYRNLTTQAVISSTLASNNSLDVYLHSALLASYSIPFATRLPFEGIVQTAQSIRMTSTAAQLTDRGVICAGNFPPRVLLSELAFSGFRGLSNLPKTYTGPHKNGGYSFQLPNSTPYYMEGLAHNFTERPNFAIIAQIIIQSNEGDNVTFPSHEITTCSHFMGSCIDTSYAALSCPVGYLWYDVFIGVLENSTNGTENPGHSANARKIIEMIHRAANSSVTKFAINSLGMIAPRASKGAEIARRATSGSTGFLLDYI